MLKTDEELLDEISPITIENYQNIADTLFKNLELREVFDVVGEWHKIKKNDEIPFSRLIWGKKRGNVKITEIKHLIKLMEEAIKNRKNEHKR